MVLRAGTLWALALVTTLVACVEQSPRRSLQPQARPGGLSVPSAGLPPSARSQDLARYYRIVQNDLLTQGLLRTDGGGPDTPYSAEDLARNFEQIVFYEEYSRRGSTNVRGGDEAGRLSRWSGPIRIGIEFGESLPEEKRLRDGEAITKYADRLARLSGHPISTGRGAPNFHVFVAGEDDRAFVQERLKALVPTISDSELELFANLPRSFYCLVVTVASARAPHDYARAVALVRAEHPDLVRLSCIHEEIAQGLGLPNDTPQARPSIFNDDDEFALLTSHDEKLIKMLYDPRLSSGMSAEEARPIVRLIAMEMMGQNL